MAAEEGRRVYANIRRFLLAGLALPLLPAQILWVNLLTHGLPGVALGSEPADPAAMRRPPRPPAQSVLGAGLWQRIVRVGVCPVVGSYGGKDRSPMGASAAARLEQVLTALGVDHDIKVYPDAGHGFINDHDPADMTPLLTFLNKVSGTRYHQPSAADAHRRIADFFSRHLTA